MVSALTGNVTYTNLLDRLGQLMRATNETYVVFSANYEQHFNSITREARQRGLDSSTLECSKCNHFDLIGPKALKERLEGLLG